MNRKKQQMFEKIKGGLIVSCQALPNEPLHSSLIMSRMAYAAQLGGAIGIRANSVNDIKAIKEAVDLPMIGLIKKVYAESDVYITPTCSEVDALVSCGADVIAMDATTRIRPGGQSLDDLFSMVKNKYQDMLFMADCSTFEEAQHAVNIGFDCVGSTLCGYTDYTKDTTLPNYSLLKKMCDSLPVPVIAEGGIWTGEQLKEVFKQGVHAAVMGTAITRPMEITKRFISYIPEE